MQACDVLALAVGDSVYICKEGREPVLCTVAFRGNPANKFLTYRDNGQIKRFAIRDYPEARYEKGGSA